jgi:cobalt-zinc-cadmium efflux system outer membrane protein
MPKVIPGVVLAWAVCQTGCATVNPQQDYMRARELIEKSTGFERAYNPEEVGLSEDELSAMLADGLALDGAVQLALLNNRQLQISFLDIGIARADLVQSGLFSNPSLGVGVLFPSGGGRSNIQANIAHNIVQIWQMPVKKRLAEHALEQKIVTVARLAGELVAKTKRAYYLGAAAQDLVEIAQQNLALVTKSYDAISALREAGAASLLDDNLQRGEVLGAELGLRNAGLVALNAKRSLARLLSLDQRVEELTLTDALPEFVSPTLDSDSLIARARNHRLDLQALSEAVLTGEAEVELEYLRVFPEISVGVGGERLESRGQSGRNVAADFARSSLRAGSPTIPAIPTQGERAAADRQEIDYMWGPNLSVTLPIFDQNQAQIARAQYVRVQAIKSYEDLYLNIAQDIRIAVDRASVLWTNVAFYREGLLPQAQKNLDFTDAAYKAGTTNVLTLLESQRALLETRRGYILAWSDASTSLSDLERAVGLPLETATAEASAADPIEISQPLETQND